MWSMEKKLMYMYVVCRNPKYNFLLSIYGGETEIVPWCR